MPHRPKHDVGVWWCNSHRREASYITKDGLHKCDPKLGGITLPCFVVYLEDVEIVEIQATSEVDHHAA